MTQRTKMGVILLTPQRVEQIKRVFDDNLEIPFVISP